MSGAKRKIDRNQKKPNKKKDLLANWDDAKDTLETHMKMIDTYIPVINDVKEAMVKNSETNTDAYKKLDGMSKVLADTKEDGVKCREEISIIDDELEHGIEMIETALKIGQIANNTVTVVSDFTDFSADVYGIEPN